METKKIRNIVLLGHSGSGKSTFAETMLFEANAIKRRGTIQEGSTISDFTNIEKDKGNSIFSSLMHLNWRGNRINIMDTPGLDDLIGEAISSMKVADTGVMILNAKSGVEVGTEILWDYTNEYNTPMIFVINQLDHENANYEDTLAQAKERFGNKVLPFQYPLKIGKEFNTIIDALRMVMYVFPPEGGKPEKQPIPELEKQRAQEMHNALVEAAAENDEELMEKFFEDGTLSEDELAKGLTKGLVNHDVFPVFCASAENNMGTGRIMGFLNDIAPSPADRADTILQDGSSLKCSKNEDTTIFIYKTMSEPGVGNLSYFKVMAGKLNTGTELVNAENGTTERFSQIYVANGKVREQQNELLAGDLGVTVKLKNTHTNNTLNVKGVERKIVPIDFPSPRHRAAVVAPSTSDVEKMAKALHSIHEEDPTLIVEFSKELKQTILHGQGKLHFDIVKYKANKVYNVDFIFERPKIPYRETITKSADEHYRHKKQSGGSGQFAEVHMRIEPYYDDMPDPSGLNVRNKSIEDLPWGGKLAFYWCIIGGSIDARFSNAIKKGILQKMEEGPLTGSNCRDIRVSVYDGKMHAVDSNDMAFMIASAQAFKNVFHKSAPQILEPIYELNILCDNDVMGLVMSDLNTRRAIILGMDTEGHYQKITAKVPLKEMYDYSSSLRSITQGKAKFSRKFIEYAQIPHDIQQALVNNYSTQTTDV